MQRFYFIELLRFLASIVVIIRHYHFFFYPRSSSSTIYILNNVSVQPFYSLLEIIYTKGDYAVQIFWAISGFIFSLVYLEQRKNITSKEFFINRFARLYPLHFLTLVYVTLIQFVNYKIFGQFQIVENNDIYRFILQIFFISGLEGESFNLPIWSVSIEILIYFFFFTSIIYLNKFRMKYTIFIYIISLLVEKLILSTSLVHCLRLFFTGVIIYQINFMTKNKILLIFYSIILILLSFLGNFKIYIFAPGIIFLFVALEYFINSKKKEKLDYLGRITYSSYLLHIPIMLTIVLFFYLFKIEEKIFLTNQFFLFYLSFVILISCLIFKFYENPLNKKIRKLIN
jgi:peptidoglycan/LPS O-acetylase OafA/YrhL